MATPVCMPSRAASCTDVGGTSADLSTASATSSDSGSTLVPNTPPRMAAGSPGSSRFSWPDASPESLNSRHSPEKSSQTTGMARDTLVWCYERCHKKEMTSFREQLTEAVQDVGGRVFCLKKSFGFQRWAPRTRSRFFVLLADWREAKPSIDFLIKSAHEKSHVVVVHTEQEKQYKNAVQWTSWLPALGYNGLVHVLPPSYSGKKLALYVAQLFWESAGAELRTCDACSSSAFSSSWALPALDHRGFTPLVLPFLPQACSDATNVSVVSQQIETQQVDLGVAPIAEESFISVEGGSWAMAVVLVLATVFPVETRAQINSALIEMQPTHYED